MCTSLIQKLQEMGKLVYLVYYGNKAGNDDDWFAVYEATEIPFAYRPIFNGDDIYPCTLRELRTGLAVFDPLFTEPVLTGELVYGEMGEFQQLRDLLHKRVPSIAATIHLLRKAEESLLAAGQYTELASETSEVTDFMSGFQCITFAASYLMFAKYYSTNDSVVTWSNLLQEQPIGIFTEIYESFKRTKRGGDFKFGRLVDFLRILRAELKGIETAVKKSPT